jgi:branched-chain amino acid transport system substrate-binding protein
LLGLAGCESPNVKNRPTVTQAPASQTPAGKSSAKPPEIASLPPAETVPPVQEPTIPAPGVVLTPPEGIVERVPVGLLLPLSGDAAELGNSLLEAAQLALFEVAGKKFELVPRDTMGTPEGARAAAEAALDSGAQFILGPVFAAVARATVPVTQARSVAQIAFTNDRTAAGPDSYVIGLLPEQRVERVVAHAASRGVIRFAALIPEGEFGDRVVADYQQAVARAGGELVRIARYAPTTEAVTASIKRLGDYDARRGALIARRQALQAAGDAKSLRELKALEKRETLGDVAFDAVLLLETGAALNAVAPLLPYYKIDTRKVRVLGIHDWSALELRREAALAGAWFAAPDPEVLAAFAERFGKIYGKPPHPLASLAYDATALAAVLAEGEPPAFTADRLTVAHGFAGSTGLFRFAPSGRVEHRFAVMEVQPDAVRVIAPAPTSFAVTDAPSVDGAVESPADPSVQGTGAEALPTIDSAGAAGSSAVSTPEAPPAPR